MYYSKRKTYTSIENIRLIDIDGFLMRSRAGLKVQGEIINNLKVVNTSLANFPIEYELMGRYERITGYLVELIDEDAGSGEGCREALNQIERFRLIMKNRYKNYVEQKMYDNILKILKKLEAEAESRLIEIRTNLIDKENGKSR